MESDETEVGMVISKAVVIVGEVSDAKLRILRGILRQLRVLLSQ